MANPKVDEVQAAARDMIERQMQERLAIVDRLLVGQQTEDELTARLTQVQQDRVRDWAEAERLGWTRKELRRIGLRRPAAHRPTTRGRRANSGSSASALASASEETSDGVESPSSAPGLPYEQPTQAAPPATS